MHASGTMGLMNRLRSPRWLAGHLLAGVALAVFVACGFWQLRRLDEVRARNVAISAGLEGAPSELEELLAERGADAAVFRRVVVTGTYASQDELLLSTRSYAGRPGHHVLTPLALGDGTGVLVDRGWVPLDFDDPPVAQASPGPDGEAVRVEGVVLRGAPDGRFAARTAAQGRVDYVGQVDLERIQAQVEVDLAPVYVLLASQVPAAPGQLPLPAATPALGEGPHLNYAVQWFLFAAVVAVGYPLLLRRTVGDHPRRPTAPPDNPVNVPSGARSGRG